MLGWKRNLLLTIMLSVPTLALDMPDEVTPAALTALAQSTEFQFAHVRDNASTEDIRRQVFSLEVDGLRQYALVLWPAGPTPEAGWPVIQFNHGFHPDPPTNGFNAQGESDRPGDYYRETAQVFARQGYVVVVPDYRGHNISQGLEFTRHRHADAWYSRDAIAFFLALSSLDDLDLSRGYMLGHSMGAAITLRAIQALGPRVRAAAVWSASGDGGVFDLLIPVSIQHSEGDSSTSVAISRELAAQIDKAGGKYQIKIYSGEDHLFTGQDFENAVARDVAWFERHR